MSQPGVDFLVGIRGHDIVEEAIDEIVERATVDGR
jgi:hypothetical protein